jgi:hypothetical protein
MMIKYLRIESEKHEDYCGACSVCEDEQLIVVDTTTKLFEDALGMEYQIEDVIETCTNCGWSREYRQ